MEKNPLENCSSKKSPLQKVLPQKYILLCFDLIGNAYSAGNSFNFSLDLIRNQKQKHVNKKRVSPTCDFAY